MRCPPHITTPNKSGLSFDNLFRKVKYVLLLVPFTIPIKLKLPPTILENSGNDLPGFFCFSYHTFQNIPYLHFHAHVFPKPNLRPDFFLMNLRETFGFLLTIRPVTTCLSNLVCNLVFYA